MIPSLQLESEKLARSWMQHDAAWLRDYLVASVEDPRINLQSILTRHFLIRELCGEGFGALMREEYKFSASIFWLLKQLGETPSPDDCEAILFALRRRADNAEGIEVPEWLHDVFASLPMNAGNCTIPNYIEQLLSAASQPAPDTTSGYRSVLNLFANCWSQVLAAQPVHQPGPKVLEVACGSANDYRFLYSYGIAPFIDFTGIDLCEKNIQNARTLFPDVRFEVGNVFEIAAADKAFDYCLVHDLFEHLSLEGLEVAINEVCRVTRRGLCLGFFQMDEIPEHVARPIEDYHWNLLSMSRMKQAFQQRGFSAQAIHIGTFQRQNTGRAETHNPEAYTFVVQATEAFQQPGP